MIAARVDSPASRGVRPAPVALHHVERVMGTVVSFDVRVADGAPLPWLALARSRKLLHQADAVFSTWREHSPINLLRRGEIDLEDCPPEVPAVLARCEEARRLSGGWFDPWAMPGGVDPTGLVKGWAAQRALDELARSGIEAGLVNAAGDVAAFGRPPGLSSWRVGIRHPRSAASLIAVAALEGAIATSGTYERGAHLFDPRTGEASAAVASATVVGPDLALADALATAFAVGGREALDAFLESSAAGGGAASPPARYEALLVGFDGSLVTTPGFPLCEGA